MALYHKHRPQTFDTMIHQEHIITTLKNQIRTDKVAHAYLFSGPHGIGKTTTARILAKSLNCEQRKNDQVNPCDKCDTCRDISEARSIDVIEIDAASQTGVDNVRENIIENAQFKATRSPYKIFIIDEVHMLSTGAFNALLKTLEEPPVHVVFILATTDMDKLPSTVISRCQRFTFSRVPDDTLKDHLTTIATTEGVTIDDDVLTAIVRKARGGARDAISILDQLITIGEKQITVQNASFVMPTTSYETQINFLTHLITKNSSATLEDIQSLVTQGTHLHIFTEEIINLLRVLMIASIDPTLAKKEVYLAENEFDRLYTLNQSITPQEIVTLTDLVTKRMNNIRGAILPQLPLELLVIEWSEKDTKDNVTIEKNIATKPPQPTSTPPSTPVTPPKPPTQQPNTDTPPKEKTPDTTDKSSKAIVMPTNTDTMSHRDIPDDVDMLTMKKAWNTMITTLEKDSPSLVSIFKNSEARTLTKGILNVYVAYEFHQDKITQPINLKKIEDALTNELQFRVEISVMVDNTLKKQTPSDNLGDLAAALGGSVVS